MPEPETPLVRVRELSVRYGDRRGRGGVLAVDGVSFDVPRGRTVGLVGESGSGKSSIGAALLGLVRSAAGEVCFDGADVTNASRSRRRLLARRMQVVFQDPFGSMNPVRTVGETLGEALRHNFRLPAGQVRERIATAVTEVGLDPAALDRYPHSFSGGQRQRLAIARAIAAEPGFIVCDEAVSALDLSVQAQVLNLLGRLKQTRGLSYLFISHDLSVVRYLSDEIVVLYAGRVVESGPAAQVHDHPAHPYTRALVAAAPVPDPDAQVRRRTGTSGEQPPTGSPPASGCAFAHRCPFAIERCRTERPELLPRPSGAAVACHRHDELDTNADSTTAAVAARGKP